MASAASSDDELLDGITRLTPALLTALEAFEQVQREMHPTRLGQLGEFMAPFEASLREVFADFERLTFPEHLEVFGGHLQQAATYSLRACDGITNSGGDNLAAMRGMRAQYRAQEALYPVAAALKPVSQYFLEPGARDNEQLLKDLNQDRGGQEIGLLATNKDRSQRGGFALYVPENLAPGQARPLVIALHGGTGHGADFLWAWLREARTRGFLLLAPTSQLDTWSLMGEEHDLPTLLKTLEFISSKFSVDEEHILLTGMSDGATYSLLAGLRQGSPFTHLAPFSGVLHPEIAMGGRLAFAKGRRIYLVHGSHDWMFPIETAYMAKQELEAAGAELCFRPIEGLSHTYCRTEHDALLRWFDSRLTVPTPA